MMPQDFSNVYEDTTRANAYAKLEFPGTYYLGFRDLPDIISRHVRGKRALDFGCGAGRSTRFLKRLGFDVTGVDISLEMLSRARELDPSGDYRLIADADFSALSHLNYNLILCAFTFDNIPSEKKITILQSLKSLMSGDGYIINLVSSAEIYFHEWLSFSTKDFPENREAKTGAKVRIIMLDVEDRRPVEDVFCTDDDYRQIYNDTGLKTVETHRPLGNSSEPFAWTTETKIAPWVIWLLATS